MATKTYKITDKGGVNAFSGNMMATNFITISDGVHAYDILSRIPYAQSIGDEIDFDIEHIDPFNIHQLN